MRRIAIFALSLLLSACATIPRLEASNDLHAFLVAIRDGDRAAFDAHVDRPALKAQLRSRLLAEAAGANGAASASTLGALLAGPLVDFGVDTLARPEVFRAIAIELGYDVARPLPNALALAPFVRPLDSGRACVITKKNGPCILIFKDEAGTWKLIGFEGRIGLGKGGKLALSAL
jgi:hypothetical protein